MLEPITDHIWTISAEFKVFGLIQLNGRATVIRLSDGSLWVHSPVALSDELRAQLDALGPVRHLVAPSLLHHLYVGMWREAYPEALVYAPKGLQSKRPDLQVDHVLSTRDEALQLTWSEEIEHVTLRGMPKVREHVFYHKASQTCIVTDLCFYFAEARGFTKLYLKLNQVYQRLGSPLIFQLMIKDRVAFNRSLVELEVWEVKALSLCHHMVIKGEGLEAWRDLLSSQRNKEAA